MHIKSIVYYLLSSGGGVALFSSCSTDSASFTTPPGTITEAPPSSDAETVHRVPAASVPPRQKVDEIVCKVLDAHNFVPPLFIEGTNSVRWAVSTRAGSQHEAVLASVKISGESEILVEILLYAHVGSTWALLGPNFRGMTDAEAREMTGQIRERVSPMIR
jgi:hypothetical protein